MNKTRRTVSRFCQALAIAAVFCQTLANPLAASAAWDFLWHDAQGRACATRAASPFAVSSWEYRVEALPAQWILVGDEFWGVVSYDDESWVCRDGSILPAFERPKKISRLDLLMVLREMGKMQEFLTWLDESGYKPFFDAAQVMVTDHPLYEQALSLVQEALGLTDAERDAILERIAK